MRPVRRLAAAVVGLGVLLSLAAGSRAPWTLPEDHHGMLRLTLSARPQRLESCRRVPDAELARRPVHMRQAVECDGRSATYRLRVWSEETLLADDVLHGGGLRRDRPIHLLREFSLSPGTHRLRIEVQRIESIQTDARPDTAVMAASQDRAVREAAERERRRMEALPPLVELEGTFVISPRAVTLVTWDPVTRALRTVSAVENER